MPLTYAKKEKKTRYGLDIYIATSDGFISIIVVVGGVLSKPTKTVPRYEQNCWHEAFAVVLLCKLIRFLHFIGITLNKKESLKLKGSYIYCLSIQAIVQKEKKKKKKTKYEMLVHLDIKLWHSSALWFKKYLMGIFVLKPHNLICIKSKVNIISKSSILIKNTGAIQF